MLERRICAVCGKEYDAIRPNQMYCDKVCYNKANKAQQKEWRKTNAKPKANAESLNEQWLERVKASAARLAAINEAARAVGMEYGEYTARTGV